MNLIPFMGYADVERAIGWLAEAFGFERHAIHEADGAIQHAELRFDDGMVMVGPAREGDFGVHLPSTLGGVTGGVYVIVDDDIDAHYERARAAGAEIVMELKDTDYGSRDYVARDPEGYVWAFGTYRPE